MTTLTVNQKALAHARQLIGAGKVSRDERDDWSEHAPSAAAENEFIEKNGFAAGPASTITRTSSGP